MNQIGILNPLNTPALRRLTAITVICIFGFIGVGLSIPMIFSEFARQIDYWFAPYAGFVTIANLVCMIGLWRTKKWGLYAYSTLVLINQIVLITKGELNILILIIQGIIILIGLYHLHPETRPTYLQVALYLKRKA
ncbi:MAG: hypothetical protein AAF620_11070 [Bacteroidota bacterium]